MNYLLYEDGLRCAKYNNYCWKKWNWQSKFKFLTRMFVFHFTLMPLGKAWIHLFSYGYILGQTRFFSFGKAMSLRTGKPWNLNGSTPFKKYWTYAWHCIWENTLTMMANTITLNKILFQLYLSYFYIKPAKFKTLLILNFAGSM